MTNSFERGDYCSATLGSQEDPIRRGAALILLGNHEAGLSILGQQDQPEVIYYRAFGFWGLGENEKANEILQRYLVKTPSSDPFFSKNQKLFHLIHRSRPIRVLVQARDSGVSSAMRQARQFEIITLGHTPGVDILLEPHETLSSAMKRLPQGWVPDFYLCHQIEFDLMPVGIENAPFPVLGYSSDYDVHVSSTYHLFRLLDAVVVIDSVDHHEVSQGIGVNTFTYMNLLGIDPKIARISPKKIPREIDVFFSGLAFNPYQDDKARLLFRASQLAENYSVFIAHRYFPAWKYFDYMGRSKLTITYVRRKGAFPSRAIDALSQGTVALYEEGGRLGLFFSEAEGAVPYREDNLESVLKKVVREWETTYKFAAERGREKVINHFQTTHVMERYLKFLALLASNIDVTQRDHSRKKTELRYLPNLGGLPLATPDYNLGTCQKNIEKLRGTNQYNHLATNCFTAHAYQERIFQKMDHQWLDKSFIAFEEGLQKDLTNLPLLFNYGRVCYHYGKIEESQKSFERIASETSWDLDPLAPLFSSDFFPDFFPYRQYTDGLFQYLMKKTESKQFLIDLIRSSALIYLAHVEFDKKNYEMAAHYCEKALSDSTNIAPYHLFYFKILAHLFQTTQNFRHLEQALQEFRSAFKINHSMIHPALFDLIKVVESSNSSDAKMELNQYVKYWHYYIKARRDFPLDKASIQSLKPYLDCRQLVKEKKFFRWRDRTKMVDRNYLMAKLKTEKKKLLQTLWKSLC